MFKFVIFNYKQFVIFNSLLKLYKIQVSSNIEFYVYLEMPESWFQDVRWQTF